MPTAKRTQANDTAAGMKDAPNKPTRSSDIRKFTAEYGEATKKFIQFCIQNTTTPNEENLDTCPFVEYIMGLRGDPNTVTDFHKQNEQKVKFLDQKGISEVTLGDMNRPEMSVLKENVSLETYTQKEKTGALDEIRQMEIEKSAKAAGTILTPADRRNLQEKAKVRVDTSVPSPEIIPITLSFVNSILRRI